MEDETDPENPLMGFWLEGDSLAPPCQCEMDVVSSIVGLASPYLNEQSILFDLGCGDGRICIGATKATNCFSLGCEIEEVLIKKFTESVNAGGLESKVSVVQGDLRELDLSKANVIVVYLLPESIEQIKPKLIAALENNTVLIFNTWGLKHLTPKQRINCGFSDNVTLLMYDKSCL
jgi:precorrin-6B methylase 2